MPVFTRVARVVGRFAAGDYAAGDYAAVLIIHLVAMGFEFVASHFNLQQPALYPDYPTVTRPANLTKHTINFLRNSNASLPQSVSTTAPPFSANLERLSGINFDATPGSIPEMMDARDVITFVIRAGFAIYDTCVDRSPTPYDIGTWAIIITAIGIAIKFLQAIHLLQATHIPFSAIFPFFAWVTFALVFVPLGFGIFQTRHPQIADALTSQPWLVAFTVLAAFKFLKATVHTVAFYLITRPIRQIQNPTIRPRDVTVVIPTVGEFDDEFIECIESILANNPGQVIVSTVGLDRYNKALKICSEISIRYGTNAIQIVVNTEPNKRAQLLKGVGDSTTKITVYADDHVFWPSTFLESALAPFEDQRVGIVGTAKKVRRDRSGGIWGSFMNYIACLYLERHNFECTASSTVDGGVFVISGRTALVRTSIIHDLAFRVGFLNDMWLWGRVGPLNVDDDNFITRWMVNNGWKTVFHNSPDAVIETTLGANRDFKKFWGQLLRWARTTWRSNFTSLFIDCKCWSSHPWTTYAMFISSFVNIALIYDPLLIITLYRSGHTQYMLALVVVIIGSKLIKPIEHLRKEPRDIKLALSLGLLFVYMHSLVRLWALFTVRDVSWSGRKNIPTKPGPFVKPGIPGAALRH